MMSLSQSEQPVSGGFRVDVSRGQRIGRVSSEWFSRPDDECYLNLPELYDAVRNRAERAPARTVESKYIRVEANRESVERLALIVPGRDEPVAPTHWSFGQFVHPCRRADIVSAATPRNAVGYQSATWLAVASR
jgi:hypothetical protein